MKWRRPLGLATLLGMLGRLLGTALAGVLLTSVPTGCGGSGTQVKTSSAKKKKSERSNLLLEARKEAKAGEVESAGAGGLSGAPLKRRSLEVLKRLRARAGDRLVLVSVGGVETADDAWERLQAGATLVQAYTGLIYGGPAWPSRVNRGLAAHLRRGAAQPRP